MAHNALFHLFQEQTSPFTVVTVSDKTSRRIQTMTDIPEMIEIHETTDIPEMIEIHETTDIPEMIEIHETTDIPEMIEIHETTDIPEMIKALDIHKEVIDIHEMTLKTNQQL